MRRLSFLALSTLVACDPPTPDVDIDFVNLAPLEIDDHQDICTDPDGKNAVAEPYWSEEFCANITVPVDDWYIEARQVALDFTDYCITYLVQNESGDIPKYCNGIQLHLDAGEPGTIALRAVANDQKQAAADISPNQLVVKATLTLYSTNRWNGEQIKSDANIDMLFGDFDNCDGQPEVTCASGVVAGE